jgi:hypothetical protein
LRRVIPSWRRIGSKTSGVSAMSTVTVYQYMVLDHFRVERRKARRWGTREGIEALKDFAEILEDTAAEVDVWAVDSIGFTGLDFDPHSA